MATAPRKEADRQALDALAAHEELTEGVHGIADTSALATKDEVAEAIEGGAGLAQEIEDRKSADAAEATARAKADETESAARKSHEGDTTEVHGIPDTAEIANKTEVAGVASDLEDEADTREAVDDAEAKARADGDIAEASARTAAIEDEQAARAAAIDGEREDREAADSVLAKAVSDAQATADAALPVAGGTMEGDILLPRDPDAPLKAATKQYTDAAIVAAVEDLIGTAPEALDTLGEVVAALKKAEESDESALEALTALIETKLAKGANGSDIPDAAQFRTNIGLGTAATHAAGDFDLAGAAAAAQAAAVAASQPLSAVLTTLALASKVEAFGRELLELATAAKVREKLGLGSAAVKDAGAAGEAGKVLSADDATTTNARTPTKHAASHKVGSTDALAPGDIGAASASELTAEETRAKKAEGEKVPQTRKVAGHELTGDVTVSKGDVGLGSVDNTSDAEKNEAKATLKSKRVPPRVLSITSEAEPKLNTDEYDQLHIKALAAAITSMSAKLTGTPESGEKLIVRILDNGTARAITWGASFAARGVALPTTTVKEKYLYVGFLYNSTAKTWDCVAVSQEA